MSSSTRAPGEQHGATDNSQLQRVIIISVCVAVGVAIILVVAFLLYRRKVKKDEKRAIRDREELRRRNAAKEGYSVGHLPAAPAPKRAVGKRQMRRGSSSAGIQDDLENINNISTRQLDLQSEELAASDSPKGILRKGVAGQKVANGQRLPPQHTETVSQVIMSGAVDKEKEDDYELPEEDDTLRSASSPKLPQGVITTNLLTKNASFRSSGSKPTVDGEVGRRAADLGRYSPVEEHAAVEVEIDSDA